MHLTGRPRLIREINRTLVLDTLRHHGPLSRPQLAARTGMSLPAVSRAVGELLADGWIRELGKGRSSGGRRPVLLAFNPDARYVIGLDVRPDLLLGIVTNLEGRVLTELREPVRVRGEPLVQQVCDFAAALVRDSGIPPQRLAGAGVAVPGICQDGRVVKASPGLGWEGVAVAPPLERVLACPVYVENDVNALLLGEQWHGAAQRAHCAAAMLVGMGGVGAAVLVDGKLYTGRSGAAGEIGYWRLQPGDPSLDTTAAVTAWVERWRASRGSREAGFDAWVAAARAGDAHALAALRPALDRLAVAAANLVALLNPELLVLGGEVLAVSDLVLPALQEAVAAACPDPVPVVPARLGERAVVLGAVRGVLDRGRTSITVVTPAGGGSAP